MTRDRNAQAWRAAQRATRVHAEPGVWRTRLAACLYAATQHAGVTHVTVVTCVRDRPDLCEYGYYPRRDVVLGDLVFSRIMPRLIGQCRAKWDDGLRRHGPVVPVFEVFGGGPIDGPFRAGCRTAGIEGALLGGLWVDSGLVGYVMVAARGDESLLWRRLAPDLERIIADAEKMLAFATRIGVERGRAFDVGSPLPTRLSRREHDVASLAAEGYSDVNIAARLGISEATVGTHLHRIYRKLDVHNRVGLAKLLGMSAPTGAPAPSDFDLHARAGEAFTRNSSLDDQPPDEDAP